MKRRATPESMKLRMADLCSRSEQCKRDIANKLKRAGLTSSETETILDFLTREHFIDELRFATAFARDKVRFSGWGPYKVKMGLYAKGISNAIISKAIAGVDDSDFSDALQRVASTRAKRLDLTTHEDCIKLYRYLLSHGFSSEDSKNTINSLRKNSDRK